MKKTFIKRIAVATAALTLLLSMFAVTASAEVWEIAHPASPEKIVLHAELNDGVMKLKMLKDGKTTTCKLSEFITAKVPWKNSTDYMKIKEIYFQRGITDLDGLKLLSLDRAEIIHIPTTVTDLGDVFSMFTLKTVYFGGSEKKWNELAAGKTFGGLGRTQVIFESSDTDREVDELWEVGAYSPTDVVASRTGDTLYLEGRGKMRDYVLSPAGYDNLAPWAQNNNIKHVVICDGVRNVGDYSFWNNSTIEDVVIAGSVTVIGEEAFYATGLTEVRVPASVTEIKKEAFGSCTKMTTLYLTQNVDTIGDSVFGGCSKLATVNYGGSKAFWDKTNIGDKNDELDNANFVYNYVTPENTPASTDKPIIGGNKNKETKNPEKTPNATSGAKETAPERTKSPKASPEETAKATAAPEKTNTKNIAGGIVFVFLASTVVLLAIAVVILALVLRKKI